MRGLLIVLAVLVSVSSGAQTLDSQVQQMITHSLPNLACNLSVGTPGAIIASPERNDPNYYYHWVRDSALIVDALVRLLPYVAGTPNEAILHGFIADFSSFSERLQNAPTANGLGEVRFNVDGSVDTSDWPRPQYDGPALRALALIRYLRSNPNKAPSVVVSQMRKVIERDLDAVVQYYGTAGFDLWEYSIGFHFYTRMVQAAALREGLAFFGHRSAWEKAESELRSALENHWNSESEVIAFNDGPAFDYYKNRISAFPVRYDTSVALAVNHAQLSSGKFSAMDDRVWFTLEKLAQYFLDAFPLNQSKRLGPAIGRHRGDDYYGGNAFFFLTSAYSEMNFHLAKEFNEGKGSVVANRYRIPTFRRILNYEVKRDSKFRLPDATLASAFAAEGDAYLKTMLDAIPPNGEIAEQLSKVDGSPASARSLSWSYASVLTAILEREKFHHSSLDFSALDFTCPATVVSEQK